MAPCSLRLVPRSEHSRLSSRGMKEHERQDAASARSLAADARDKRRAELLSNRRYPVDDGDLMEENALRAEIAGVLRVMEAVGLGRLKGVILCERSRSVELFAKLVHDSCLTRCMKISSIAMKVNGDIHVLVNWDGDIFLATWSLGHKRVPSSKIACLHAGIKLSLTPDDFSWIVNHRVLTNSVHSILRQTTLTFVLALRAMTTLTDLDHCCTQHHLTPHFACALHTPQSPLHK